MQSLLERLLFIFATVGYADGEFSQAEKAYVLDKFSYLEIDDGVDVAHMLQQVATIAESLSLEQRLQQLATIGLELPFTKEELKQLLEDIEGLIEVDGRVKKEEITFYRKILLSLY